MHRTDERAPQPPNIRQERLRVQGCAFLSARSGLPLVHRMADAMFSEHSSTSSPRATRFGSFASNRWMTQACGCKQHPSELWPTERGTAESPRLRSGITLGMRIGGAHGV